MVIFSDIIEMTLTLISHNTLQQDAWLPLQTRGGWRCGSDFLQHIGGDPRNGWVGDSARLLLVAGAVLPSPNQS